MTDNSARVLADQHNDDDDDDEWQVVDGDASGTTSAPTTCTSIRRSDEEATTTSIVAGGAPVSDNSSHTDDSSSSRNDTNSHPAPDKTRMNRDTRDNCSGIPSTVLAADDNTNNTTDARSSSWLLTRAKSDVLSIEALLGAETDEREDDNHHGSAVVEHGTDAIDTDADAGGVRSWARKTGVALAGGTMVGVGLIMIPLPTPFGCVVAGSGMAVLGTEFPAAQRALGKTCDTVADAIEHHTQTKPNTHTDSTCREDDGGEPHPSNTTTTTNDDDDNQQGDKSTRDTTNETASPCCDGKEAISKDGTETVTSSTTESMDVTVSESSSGCWDEDGIVRTTADTTSTSTTCTTRIVTSETKSTTTTTTTTRRPTTKKPNKHIQSFGKKAAPVIRSIGKGIDKEQLQQASQKFTQATSSVTSGMSKAWRHIMVLKDDDETVMQHVVRSAEIQVTGSSTSSRTTTAKPGPVVSEETKIAVTPGTMVDQQGTDLGDSANVTSSSPSLAVVMDDREESSVHNGVETSMVTAVRQ